MLRTWAEINLDALRRNYDLVRARVGPDVAVMAVVKADAYGHGAVEVVRALGNPLWLGVATVEEGVVLRADGLNSRILVLGGYLPGDETTLEEQKLTPIVFDPAQIIEMERRNIPYHLKVDTGMGRLGLALAAVAAAIPHLGKSFDGLATHFAAADQESPQNDVQLAAFCQVQRTLAEHGHMPPWIHASNSAAMARRTDCWGNLVRPGLALYGYVDGPSSLPVEPVLSLRTRLLSLKEFPSGAALGYGGSFKTKGISRIAVAGAGYADGVPRALSNKGHAIVRGQRVPIVGRVNMDMTLLDVTAVSEAAAGDVATFIGRDAAEQITARDVAAEAGTSPYEILCHIGRRVPRTPLH